MLVSLPCIKWEAPVPGIRQSPQGGFRRLLERISPGYRKGPNREKLVSQACLQKLQEGSTSHLSPRRTQIPVLSLGPQTPSCPHRPCPSILSSGVSEDPAPNLIPRGTQLSVLSPGEPISPFLPQEELVLLWVCVSGLPCYSVAWHLPAPVADSQSP